MTRFAFILKPARASLLSLICSGALVTATQLGICQEFQFSQLPKDDRSTPVQAAPAGEQEPGPTNERFAGFTQSDAGKVEQASFSKPAVSAKYQLQLSSWREIEHKLMNCWIGQMPQVTEGGLISTFRIPGTKSDAEMQVNRQTKEVSFKGEPELIDSWKQCMTLLDRYDAEVPGGKVELVTLRNLRPELASTAVRLMAGKPTSVAMPSTGPLQPRQPGAMSPVGQQGTQGTNQDVQDVVNLPLQGGNQGSIISQLAGDEALQVVGNVTVQVLPELGIVLIKGDNQEDVARVKEMIERIVKLSEENQPIIKRRELINSEPTPMAEQVKAVYDAAYAANQGPVSITAIADPKALLLVGSAESIVTLEKIIEEYDRTPAILPETTNFKSYQLKNIAAADAKQRIDEYFGQASQPAQGTPPVPAPVVTISDYRSNTLIVKGSASYLAQVEQLLEAIDVAETDSKKEVKIFRLKNTTASSIASVLQDAVNGGMANAPRGLNPNQQQQLANQGGFGQQGGVATPGQSQYGSHSLSLVTFDAQGNRIEAKSGILYDVRVTADATANAVVVTAPEESMSLIAALIDQLDRMPQVETQIKVFQVINGDAQTIFTMLQTLFSNQTQNQGGFGGGFGGAAGSQLGPIPLSTGNAVAGATLANLSFSVDQRTNTIIASGPIGDLQVIDDLIIRLDAEEMTGRQIVVYRVSNISALDMADAVNGWLDERRSLVTSIDPTSQNAYTSSRREVIVQPEVVGNSLIINARPEYLAEVMQVIEALDRRPPMVKIKVLIAEVNLSMLEEFGADLGLQDSLVFDRGIGTIGFPFNQSGIGNSTSAASLATREAIGGQALSNLGTGRINNSLGYGGLVLSAGNESVSLLLRALKDRQCARVLSSPQVVSIENQLGRVLVGATVRFVSNSTVTNGVVQNSVEAVDVGVILEITPRVTPDGMVVMRVNATNSTLGAEADGTLISTTANGDPVRIPQILKTEAQTTIMSRHGQTVVFSGLIREEKVKFERGAPFLSDIPILGNFFKFQGETAARKELMILLTPYLVDSDEDVELLNAEDFDRMHWCINDVAEVYGSVNYDQTNETYSTPQTYYPDNDPTGLNPTMMNRPVFEGEFYVPENSDASAPAEGRTQAPAQNQPAVRPASASRIGTSDTTGNGQMPRIQNGVPQTQSDSRGFSANQYVNKPDEATASGGLKR